MKRKIVEVAILTLLLVSLLTLAFNVQPVKASGLHDVGITNVTCSKTVVGQDYSTNINVTVANQGDYTETFDVTLYAEYATGLVGYWKFDEGSGTTAYDSSGNNNDGTLVNEPGWVDGRYGKALSFDGINDYVEIPDSPELRLNESEGLTIMLWFYRISYTHYDNVLVSKQLYPGRVEYQLDLIDTGDLQFKTWDSDDNVVIGSVGVPDANKWYHVAYVMNDTHWDFYVNGTLENSGTTSHDLYVSNNNLRIGNDIGGSAFNGIVDEVKVYDRTLSAGEIWVEYTHPNTGLVGYWKFDEGSGTIAFDSSVNGNDGTLMNDPTWVDGKIGKALRFDQVQVEQCVNILDSNSLDIGTSDFTLAAWVYSEDRSGLPYGAGAILSKTLLGWPPPGYFFGISNNGSICFELTRSPGGPENFVNGASNVPVPMNEWHYVVITFQRNGNAIFYLDGNQVGSVDISSKMGDISNDRPLFIGKSETCSNQFKGNIDEVKIYNRSLSADEVLTEYALANISFAIQTQAVTLESGASKTLTFTWNTTGFAKGNYTISAYAEPVLGETDTEDNTKYSDSEVCVTIPGDMDGNLKVQLVDLVILAKAYGSKPGDSNWNSNADIDDSGSVSLVDLVIVAIHYGETYP